MCASQLGLTLCDPPGVLDYSTPGLPAHHQLPELTQTNVHIYNRHIYIYIYVYIYIYNRLVVALEERESETWLRSLELADANYYIEWINSKILLYGTGNYI